MEKKQFSIRLEMDLYKKLDEFSWKNRKSLNTVVSEAVKKYLSSKNSTLNTE